ncbi:SRPBCC family protein [Rhodoplanes sp. Z2-YC6860]|uniref:SRPBCC family protein n=1 Tax=Rhodoplanes sp. Z2-YC6860 TaxID=674703 RepID=UPI00078B7DEF|nr:SRPBCC domain-containing protein [Rhodoplanes sp. Z2-YC6860]AMN43875.1 activator of Hsp90 ATPase 1 family protein [Rhodoplanes sp. Z2-YC6860]
MSDILHRVGVKSPPRDTYKALSTRDGLAGWWTTDTKGDCDVGSVIKFQFGERGFIDMKVLELAPAKRVLWQVTGGPGEWIGTKVSFDLAPEDDFTVVRFKHQGWKEPSEFMDHCSTKWATFLMSMKSLVETGRGAPYPNDIHVANKGD